MKIKWMLDEPKYKVDPHADSNLPMQDTAPLGRIKKTDGGYADVKLLVTRRKWGGPWIAHCVALVEGYVLLGADTLADARMEALTVVRERARELRELIYVVDRLPALCPTKRLYDWNLVPEEFDAVAMDAVGEVWMYKLPGSKPATADMMTTIGLCWWPACQDRKYRHKPYPGPKPNVAWEGSLEMREESE